MPAPVDHAAILESLRPGILAQLVEARATLDHGFARLPEREARERLDAVLRHQQAYLTTWDWRMHRAFFQSFLALRAGEGMGADEVLHVLTKVGDLVIGSVRKLLGDAPEARGLVVALSKFNAHSVRAVVDLVAEELERRRAQRDQLLRGGAA
jgi:hypothetical protein